MKIGFVSATFRTDLEKWVNGIYKRMGTFIEATKDLGELDMLFYVDGHIPISNSYVAEVEEHLSDRWRARLKLTLCHLAPSRPANGRWQYYISPALSIYNHPHYSRTAGKEQVLAFNRMLSRNPDAVFVHRLQSMIPILLSGEKLPPIFFDLDDIEHIVFLRNLKQPPWWPLKCLTYLQAPILLLWERKAILQSSKTFVCSENDQKYLSKIWRLRNVVTVPNAVDIPEERELPDTPTLLFLGSFSYPANILGADYLITKIWPTILSAMPEARLIIAGAHPENIPSFQYNPEGVEFTGFVESLDELYKQVRVVCCPILSGGGTRIKILEAAAYGKPVVSTTIGAEGLHFCNGQEILLGDDPASFADACIQLLKDERFATHIGIRARSVVVRSYEKAKIVREIQEHFIF